MKEKINTIFEEFGTLLTQDIKKFQEGLQYLLLYTKDGNKKKRLLL